MALSNRDRIGRMFDAIAPALDEFIGRVLAPALTEGTEWVHVIQLRDRQKGRESKTYSTADPSMGLRMLTENITGRVKDGWYPFDDHLGHLQKSFAVELRDSRNAWAHGESFSADDTYRALDTAERLMEAIQGTDALKTIREMRLQLRRVTAEQDDRRTLKDAASENPEGEGLRPWREVLPPHDDVATGNFHASEFAADLYKVATESESESEYADPVEFFRRTHLTEGLRDLIGRGVRRTAGDSNASPVINLQTNFGGGKTHSMLALWHMAAGEELGKFPQEAQELLAENGYDSSLPVNRAAIVGNHLSPAGAPKDDGTYVNTIWGELAWQLGGAEGYAMVADADQQRTTPGQALHELLAAYAPAVILIDEWVAYARALVGRDDLPAGTFEDQFTFAQALTEAAKTTPGILLAISIPASEAGDRGLEDSDVAGNEEEVGGANGVEALKRLQNVVRRVAEQWRPASSTESYEIVRRRLFTDPDSDSAALASIRATAHQYADFYRRHGKDFPREVRENAYEQMIRRTYPIHPELFATLYEEWSSLERFQRTRGVLRLMSHVIFALWDGGDSSPLIMPGSIPLASSRVNSELTQYLQDSWKPIIDADVDGESSEPSKIDTEHTVFGQRAVTKRLARTVFFGGAPTIGPRSQQKGIDTQRIFLGTAVPGDQPANFKSALNHLSDRATYFYAGSGRYWYDVHPNITRTARDQAERLPQEDVWAEITRRLGDQRKRPGDFAGVHVCPTSNADIPDEPEARLVILPPKVAHKRNQETSEAVQFAHSATERRGSAYRSHRNMLVYLAADEGRLAELDTAVRDYLGWSHVLDQEADLDLTQNQKKQAEQRKASADTTAESRLQQTFIWALVPTQVPGGQLTITPTKVDGQKSALAEGVSKKLGSDGDLATRHAATLVRMAINRIPKAWEQGHISVGELWSLYTSYNYMPRLRDRSVLESGVLDQPAIWQVDAFGLAHSYDTEAGRYIGLVPGNEADGFHVQDSTLLVRPDVAEKQLEAEAAQGRGSDSDGGGAAQDSSGSVSRMRAEYPQNAESETSGATSRPDLVHPPEMGPKRFFGVKTLNGNKVAADFRTVNEEVIAHLRGLQGANVTVRIEIEATDNSGFDEGTTRTVSENARTLKFDQSSFEED